MRFFARLREAFSRFMQGRYGMDSLNQFLTVVWFILAVLTIFFRSLFLYIPEMILCVLVFYRMLSKNYVKRRNENAKYYDFSMKFKKRFRKTAIRWRDRKQYRFFKCPSCHADIRMPRKSGKFNIRCVKCGEHFTRTFR